MASFTEIGHPTSKPAQVNQPSTGTHLALHARDCEQPQMSPLPNMRARWSARTANIAELQEQGHEKRSSDGSPDDGRQGAAPTRLANAHAPNIRGGDPVAVQPAPRSHFQDFYGWRTTAQSQTGSPREAVGPASTPRARCLKHPLFEAELPYDLSDTRLQVVLTMLTSELCAGARQHISQDSAAVTPNHVADRLSNMRP